MTTTPESPAAPAPKSLVARFVGVVFSPQETFRSIVAHPKWLGMLVVIILLMTVGMFAFLTSEVGRAAFLDQLSSGGPFGQPPSDEQFRQIEQMANVMVYTTIGGQVVVIPIWYVIMAGVLYAVFNAGMGGTATFKQLITVVVHSGVVGVVGQLFVLPLNYVRGTMTSATNLGALLPMLPEGSFVAYLFAAIDVFMIWSVVVLAIGLAVLYRRRTQPIAITLLSIYGIIALIIAAVRTFMGGS